MAPKRRPVAKRFWERVEKTDTCWLWTGNPAMEYGQIDVRLPGGRRRGVRPHVYSWERHNKQKVPNGLVVRHKCDVPKCVNPEHLEVGTQVDNMQDELKRGRNFNKNKTRCKRGHSDWYIRPCGKKRYCKTCVRDAQRLSRGITPDRFKV